MIIILINLTTYILLIHTSPHFSFATKWLIHYSHTQIPLSWGLHIFIQFINLYFKVSSTLITYYKNACRPIQCHIIHNMDLNHHLEHATPPRIMPRTSATHYKHSIGSKSHITWTYQENHQWCKQKSMQTINMDRTWSMNIHKHHELY